MYVIRRSTYFSKTVDYLIRPKFSLDAFRKFFSSENRVKAMQSANGVVTFSHSQRIYHFGQRESNVSGFFPQTKIVIFDFFSSSYSSRSIFLYMP